MKERIPLLAHPQVGAIVDGTVAEVPSTTHQWKSEPPWLGGHREISTVICKGWIHRNGDHELGELVRKSLWVTRTLPWQWQCGEQIRRGRERKLEVHKQRWPSWNRWSKQRRMPSCSMRSKSKDLWEICGNDFSRLTALCYFKNEIRYLQILKSNVLLNSLWDEGYFLKVGLIEVYSLPKRGLIKKSHLKSTSQSTYLTILR